MICFKFFYILLLIVLAVLYTFVTPLIDRQLMTGLLAIALLGLLVYLFKREENSFLKDHNFKHSVFALVGLVVVFFQRPLDFLLGNYGIAPNMAYWSSFNVIVKGLTLSVIGFLAFLLGLIFLKRQTIKGYFLYRYKKNTTEKPVSVLFLKILVFASFIAYLSILGISYFVNGLYGVIEPGIIARTAKSLFVLSVFAVIIQTCRNLILKKDIRLNLLQYLNKIGWGINTVLGLYLILVMISGNRGPIMTLGLLVIGGYFFVTKNKLSFIKMGFIIVIGAGVISYLSYVRNNRLNGYSFTKRVVLAQNIVNPIRQKSIVPITAELSKSGNATYTALSIVPTKHSYFYGWFQLQLFTQIIPYFNHVFFNGPDRFMGSAQYLTWIKQGPIKKYGVGTNVVADFYLDFGIVGVIVGMFLFGCIIRFSEISFYSKILPGLFVTVFSFVYLSNALYISRSVLFGPIRNVVWIYFLLLLNNIIFKNN